MLIRLSQEIFRIWHRYRSTAPLEPLKKAKAQFAAINQNRQPIGMDGWMDGWNVMAWHEVEWGGLMW